MKTIKGLCILSLLTAFIFLLNCKSASVSSESSEKDSSSVTIDADEILDLKKLKDADYCAEHYPEIFYLALKNHPNAGYCAFKAAYTLANTDANYDDEIHNLIQIAYYLSYDDFTIWSRLENKEKKHLYWILEKYPQIDWESEKGKYSINLQSKK